MKKLTLVMVLVVCPFIIQAQSFSGFLTDNYSGVNSVIANPANITDSRFKTDINLLGASFFGGNDYLGLNILDATKSSYDFDSEANIYPTDNNNAIINMDVMGPAFMFNINSKSSIAVFTRARSIININGINGEFIDNLEDDDSGDFHFEKSNLITKGNAWGELGVTYARTLFNNNENFLKGGLTVKYLQGGGSVYFSTKDLEVIYEEDGAGPDNASIDTSGELTYASFANIGNEDYEYELPDASSIGFDLGFVYEWRPDYADYTQTNANGDSYNFKGENKYKLKLGVSITDIGNINYKEGEEKTYDITRSASGDDYEDDFDNADDYEDFLGNFYTEISDKKGYKTSLPTAFHFNADWSFTQRLYVNLNTDLSLISKDNRNASRIANTFSLTPRYESKWFSFYVPVGVVQYSGFQAGAGLRLGPLYLGSGSVISALTSDDSKAADVYAGLKIPVYQKRTRDKDEDGVIDKLDLCPEEAGPEENNGCPWSDIDEDGVLENVDECPNEAGPQENNGCPWGDSDGDTLLDNIDICPNEAGPVENSGCPWGDLDGDGVLDNVDECPEVEGVVEHNGCPAPEPEPEVEEITEEVLKTLNDYAKTILFNKGKATLKEESKTVLDNIVVVLNEYPNAVFSINGYTDSSGSNVLNQELSEKRASAVMHYFIEKGIGSNRLSAKGYGEENPIDTNATAIGRSNNRRVEIVLVK